MTDAPPLTLPAPEAPTAYASRLLAARQLENPYFADVSDAQAALLAALAKASKQFDSIGKDVKASVAQGSSFKYADIAAINKATRGVVDGLADCGVVVMQPLMPSPLGEGWSRITTIIAGHGATMSFPYDLHLVDLAQGVRAPSTPQKVGAVLTYMRRYLLQSALNLAGDADLDSIPQEQGKQKQDTPPVQAKPAAPKPQQRSPRKQPPPQKAKPAAAEVAKPVVAKPTVVTTAVAVPKVVPDEPSAADNEDTPDFSMREDGDSEPGEETQVTILEASAGQKAALSAGFKRQNIRQRSKIDALISGVVPGQNAKTILDNAAHTQAVIDSLAGMKDASNG